MVKRNHIPNYTFEKLHEDYPGKITNESLLKNQSEYLREDDEDDPTNFVIRDDCMEGIDYKLIPRRVWKVLEQRFGGYAIIRRKDPDTYNRKYTIKFPHFPILILPPAGQISLESFPLPMPIYMEPEDTFERIQKKINRIVNKMFGENERHIPIRVWKCDQSYQVYQKFKRFVDQYDLDKPSLLLKIQESEGQPQVDKNIEENSGIEFPGQQLDSILQKTYKDMDRGDQGIRSDQDLFVVEQANQAGQFIFRFNKDPGTYGKCENCYMTGQLKSKCICKKVSYCNESCRKNDEKYHLPKCDAENEVDFSKLAFEKQSDSRNGVVGLYNLGNTCFMNSALQCLSNTWALTKYFLEKHFIGEINEDNPLGTKGHLVFQYAKLLNELWNKGSDTFTPNQLKNVIGKQNAMFQGNAQHDSQEFLNFLLDTLHEDLNRVQKKPYVETQDSNNRPDEVVAKEFWDGHLQRNMSIIVDLFQGQYRSTLKCPNCNRISVSFDPYMSIPLPIPLNFTINYFFLHYRIDKKIYRYELSVKMSDSMMDVKQLIAKHASEFYKTFISPYEFIMAQIDKSDFSITQLFSDSLPSSVLNINLNSNFLFAYQIHPDAINRNRLPEVTDNEITEASQLPFEQKVQEDRNIDQDDEEEKIDHDEVPSKPLPQISLKKLESIPIEEMINPNWIFVQVMPAIRGARSSGNYSYMSYNQSKYENIQAIPRLFWFNKEQNLLDIYKNLVQSYSFTADFTNEQHDAEKYFEEKYEKLIYKLNNGEESDIDEMSQDITDFPFIINIINQNKSYYAPPCKSCGSKSCKNCPMPVSIQKNFGDLLDQMVHKTKFKNNMNLFVNQDEFKHMNDSDDDNNSASTWNDNNDQWSKFKTGVQDDSDDEETKKADEEKKKKEDNKGRHKVFSLELVFVNRIIRENVAQMKSKLLSFDHHPRELYEQEQNKKTYGGGSKSKSKPTQQIQDCLEYFRHTEKLDKDNSWYCNKCKDHVQASKTIEIYSVPPVIIFCLQRFKSHNIYFKDKLEDKIVFPINDLDMSPFVVSKEQKNSSLLYDLYAVSNHYGSLSFGHYTAYAKNHETGRWYDYNDSNVSECHSSSEVVSGAAYVLYYVRKDFFPDGQIDYNSIKKVIDDPELMLKLTTKQQVDPSAASLSQTNNSSANAKLSSAINLDHNYIKSSDQMNDDEAAGAAYMNFDINPQDSHYEIIENKADDNSDYNIMHISDDDDVRQDLEFNDVGPAPIVNGYKNLDNSDMEEED
eukprot:403357853